MVTTMCHEGGPRGLERNVKDTTKSMRALGRQNDTQAALGARTRLSDATSLQPATSRRSRPKRERQDSPSENAPRDDRPSKPKWSQVESKLDKGRARQSWAYLTLVLPRPRSSPPSTSAPSASPTRSSPATRKTSPSPGETTPTTRRPASHARPRTPTTHRLDPPRTIRA